MAGRSSSDDDILLFLSINVLIDQGKGMVDISPKAKHHQHLARWKTELISNHVSKSSEKLVLNNFNWRPRTEVVSSI
jgi:hypothetical protein